jgi:hypothetical protein
MLRLDGVGMGIDGERVGRFGLGIVVERPRALRASKVWDEGGRFVRGNSLSCVQCTQWRGACAAD